MTATEARHTRDDEIGLLERKRQTGPHEFAQYLKGLGPTFYWPKGGFWVITDYAIAKSAMRNPALSADRSSFFVSRMPNLDLSLIPDFFSVVQKMMVMSDGKSHHVRRAVAQRPFSDEVLSSYRSTTNRCIHQLLDQLSALHRFDFVSEIAKRLPSMILADLFCIPEEDRAQFIHWSVNMTQFFGGASQYRNEDGIAVNYSARSLINYFSALIEKRRASPKADFLSQMLLENEKWGLGDSELVAQAVMMLVAGQVTTTDQICNNIFTLLSYPEAVAGLRANPSLLPLAIEEFNRWDPGVSFLFRVVNQATEVGGIELGPGSVVFISTHAVHRDAGVFSRPDSLNLERTPNPHFAYGHGSHHCLGAPLARVQMVQLFGELLERFPHFALGNPGVCQRDHYSLAFSGFRSLEVELRPI